MGLLRWIGRAFDRMVDAICFVLVGTNQQQLNHDALMNALETLTAAINNNTAAQADLASAVNAAVTRIGTPSATDAQLLSLAGIVDHQTQVTKDQTDAINAALTPPAPEA